MDINLVKLDGTPIGKYEDVILSVKGLDLNVIDKGGLIEVERQSEHIIDVALLGNESKDDDLIYTISMTGRSFDDVISHLKGAFDLEDQDYVIAHREAQRGKLNDIEGASSLYKIFLDGNEDSLVPESMKSYIGPNLTSVGTFHQNKNRWWQCGSLSFSPEVFCHIRALEVCDADIERIKEVYIGESKIHDESVTAIKKELKDRWCTSVKGLRFVGLKFVGCSLEDSYYGGGAAYVYRVLSPSTKAPYYQFIISVIVCNGCIEEIDVNT